MFFKKISKGEKEAKKRINDLAKAQQKEMEANHLHLIERDILGRKEKKEAPEGTIISLHDVNKAYPNHVQAVYDFNLDIKPNEFIVLVGPSGCGKSTTLRMIAGLEDITCGDLFLNGEWANDLDSKERDIAMVFQNYALYPNMTVFENMGFSLLMHHHPKDEIEKKVKEAAEILGLTEYLDRKPSALSGGQRQRVALGRAIVRNSKIFLMDEPLSNLDAKLRVAMRAEIVKLHKTIGATTVYVTHDQTEAMTMADRIVVMSKGYVQQIGTPKEVYNNPINKFVATFIGSPAMNIKEATYDDGKIVFANGYAIVLDKVSIKTHDDFYANELASLKAEIKELKEFVMPEDPKEAHYYELLQEEKLAALTPKMEEVESILKTKRHIMDFGVRPEDIHVEASSSLLKNVSPLFGTKVNLSELLGHQYIAHISFGDDELIANIPANGEIEAGDELMVAFNMDHVHVFDKMTGKKVF